MGRRLLTRKQHVEEAAKARCNLNIFHGVMALLEGGTVTGDKAQEDAARIISICKAAAGKQLSIYDFHVDTASQDFANEHR